eukprot:656252-Pyramimonas_sp.AAC.1
MATTPPYPSRHPSEIWSQRSDVVIFSIQGPRKSRPIPQDQFCIPTRFLTVPRPGKGPERPKAAKKLRRDFCRCVGSLGSGKTTHAEPGPEIGPAGT